MLDLLFLFYLLFLLLPPLSLLSERDKRMLNAKFMEGQSEQELQISMEFFRICLQNVGLVWEIIRNVFTR